MKKVLLLGATGSIGTQSLDIIESDKNRFVLVGFSFGKNVKKAIEILRRFPSVKSVCVQQKNDVQKLKELFPNLRIYDSDEGLTKLIEELDFDLCVNSLVGFVGLLPSIATLKKDKLLCLANKESLVVGGEIINSILANGKGRLLPIDSEHVAIAKLIDQIGLDYVDKILITASGGSFRNKSREELTDVTPMMALAHPTWSMGAKITIDSATMMNKGFEVIEALRLFPIQEDRIEILMHDESYVHSLLRLKDGSYLADVSKPDMHNPIKWALYEKDVVVHLMHADHYEDFGDFHFHKFNPDRYPAVGIALDAYRKGGVMPAILNAANEEAVYAFLRGDIGFLNIEDIVSKSIKNLSNVKEFSLTDILKADSSARIYATSLIEELKACKS